MQTHTLKSQKSGLLPSLEEKRKKFRKMITKYSTVWRGKTGGIDREPNDVEIEGILQEAQKDNFEGSRYNGREKGKGNDI